MKIETENTYKKNYIEILPTISIGIKPFRIYIAWLFWNINFSKNK